MPRCIVKILPFAILLLLSGACSNTKFLTDDQMLYNGRKVEIKSEEKGKVRKTATEIASEVSFAEPNNSLMGKRVMPPVGLWFYNYKKPEEGERGGFLYRSLKENPVLISDVNPDLRCRKIETDLFANGFFNPQVSFKLDTSRRMPRKADVLYFVEVQRPYRISNVLNQLPTDSIDELVNKFTPELNLKAGNIFTLETIRNEKKQLAGKIVEEGYYFFSPEEIEVIADTSQLLHTIDLLVRKKQIIDAHILKKYTINKVEVRVNQNIYNTSENLNDTIFIDGIYITGKTGYLKPQVITRSILLRPGDVYAETKHRGTLPLLNNYGVFESVKMQFAVTDSSAQKMDLLIELKPKENVSLNVEGAIQSKSTGFAGPTSEISITHGNIAKTASRLQLKAFGGFEWQWGKHSENDLGANSFNAGINSSIAIPKMIVPFKSIRENKAIIGKTIGSLGFEFVNNIKYYRMSSANARFGYQWRKNQKITHQFYPFNLNSVSLLKTTPEFDSIVNSNPYVKKSFEEQQIIGTEYNFTYDNSSRKRSGFYFQGTIATSGNMLNLISQVGNNERPYKFLGEVYSQFVKTSVDTRFYTNTTKEGLVIRLYAGTGFSYGNSSVMPYVEQFFSGGSNSLRGFVARSLGPGSYKPEEYNGIIDQTGDIKLEVNTEYRFKMTEMLLGALFLETGNVWLLNPDENRPGAQFKLNSMIEQLAVGTGAGLRFDFDFFVLRTDVGLPLRFPYNDGGGNWNEFDEVFSKFRFNLAIGYPF